MPALFLFVSLGNLLVELRKRFQPQIFADGKLAIPDDIRFLSEKLFADNERNGLLITLLYRKRCAYSCSNAQINHIAKERIEAISAIHSLIFENQSGSFNAVTPKSNPTRPCIPNRKLTRY
jgi:hypothetical protein